MVSQTVRRAVVQAGAAYRCTGPLGRQLGCLVASQCDDVSCESPTHVMQRAR
jgi:hypothetical protein